MYAEGWARGKAEFSAAPPLFHLTMKGIRMKTIGLLGGMSWESCQVADRVAGAVDIPLLHIADAAADAIAARAVEMALG
jgi:hypothetical protein